MPFSTEKIMYHSNFVQPADIRVEIRPLIQIHSWFELRGFVRAPFQRAKPVLPPPPPALLGARNYRKKIIFDYKLQNEPFLWSLRAPRFWKYYGYFFDEHKYFKLWVSGPEGVEVLCNDQWKSCLSLSLSPSRREEEATRGTGAEKRVLSIYLSIYSSISIYLAVYKFNECVQ